MIKEKRLVKTLQFPKRELILKYLQVINIVLTTEDCFMTPKELKVLSEFILLRNYLYKGTSIGRGTYNVFSSKCRVAVRASLESIYGIRLSKEGLNNYIHSMVKKGILYRDAGRTLKISPPLIAGFSEVTAVTDIKKKSINPPVTLIPQGTEGLSADTIATNFNFPGLTIQINFQEIKPSVDTQSTKEINIPAPLTSAASHSVNLQANGSHI